MSWIPRHAANCVSRYRIMDDGRTPDQRRCGKTWKRPVVEFGESVHFRPVGENNALRGGDQRLLRGVYSMWDITRDLVLQFSSRRMV